MRRNGRAARGRWIATSTPCGLRAAFARLQPRAGAVRACASSGEPHPHCAESLAPVAAGHDVAVAVEDVVADLGAGGGIELAVGDGRVLPVAVDVGKRLA